MEEGCGLKLYLFEVITDEVATTGISARPCSRSSPTPAARSGSSRSVGTSGAHWPSSSRARSTATPSALLASPARQGGGPGGVAPRQVSSRLRGSVLPVGQLAHADDPPEAIGSKRRRGRTALSGVILAGGFCFPGRGGQGAGALEWVRVGCHCDSPPAPRASPR
ncbi:unnamed protein product [Prorocentrum cordatum]|uniref:Uncharacterized protein n=1 Tax=Prorocentrum cordatum TaxID=2364126 RepID=A0ABN9WS71_9DINO|nr:unnamed protein product [Polarella glacialis]